MSTPNYMKRIAFLDGQILHDFHLNIMQKNIAEAIKEKSMRERYDLLLMTSNYDYYFADPLINTEYRDPNSTAELNELTFTFYEGKWISKLIEIPETTPEFYFYCNYEDYPTDNAYVNFYYRTNNDSSTPWTKIDPDTPIYLPGAGAKYLQIMIECVYSGTIRPVVYDYAIMTKAQSL